MAYKHGCVQTRKVNEGIIVAVLFTNFSVYFYLVLKNADQQNKNAKINIIDEDFSGSNII